MSMNVLIQPGDISLMTDLTDEATWMSGETFQWKTPLSPDAMTQL